MTIQADEELAERARKLFSGPIDTPFCAVGSGADFALGAMQFGADAVQAVYCAIAQDQHTGGEVRVLLDEPIKTDRALMAAISGVHRAVA